MMDARVLIIEDEDAIADFLVRGLREEGFQVTRAADGDVGWRLLHNEAWDLVLLDWWLPHTEGITLLRRFRSENEQTPVIFLTARDAVSDRVHGLDRGADDYLCKPFAFEELLARMNVHLRRAERTPPTELKFADVHLDLLTQRVTRAGQPLVLTSREHALLVLLLRHPDEVLAKSRIYEQVWDDSYDGFSNTLEVHVMELRKKLEAFGPRLIHTIRNRGYRLGQPIG
jgi:two-component system copper resistance phosphate regulon response regulator CusR